MSKRPSGDPLLAFLGLAAIGLFGHFAFSKQRKADESEWKRYVAERGLEPEAPLWHEAYEAWHSARDYARRIDRGQLAELRRLEKVVVAAEEVVRISEGLRKAQKLFQDGSVPELVRLSILAHWVKEWSGYFHIWLEGPLDELLGMSQGRVGSR